MTNDDLAVTLSILRIVRRWSQSELAEAAGVTNSAISDYERGKVDPQTQTLQKLIRALGLPLSALDQTQAFIQMIRAQMSESGEAGDSASFSGAPEISPGERELRAEIALIASEGGRFASRLTRTVLELLAQDRRQGSPEDRQSPDRLGPALVPRQAGAARGGSPVQGTTCTDATSPDESAGEAKRPRMQPRSATSETHTRR